MKRRNTMLDFDDPESTPDELGERKLLADRRFLLHHVDHLLRPPGWIYDEIEEAIQHALAGNLTAEVKSRDGSSYVVADLVERWEIDEQLLDAYARPPDDPSYGRPGSGW